MRRGQPRAGLTAFVLAAALLAAAAPARAGVRWSCSESDAGEGLAAYVFRFVPDDLPIAGLAIFFRSPRMHHVEPHGLWTVFGDNNAAFASIGAEPGQDSQWLFVSSGPGRNVVVAPNDRTREGPGFLHGDFELIEKRADPREVARIVVPQGDEVRFVGVVGVDDGRPGELRRKHPVEGRVGGAGGRCPAASDAGER